MKWQILTLTQPSRKWYLARLVNTLKAQLRDLCGEVAHVVTMHQIGKTVGESRQAMVENAVADYVSFVDDDDLVSWDYVSSIFPLLDGRDLVGFQLQMYVDGVKLKPTYHNPELSCWSEDEKAYYRDISHLSPIRRELARRVKFDGGFGEDERWAAQVREKSLVKTYGYVDKVLYHYYYRSVKNDGVRA